MKPTRLLIAYSSRHGQTARIAARLRDTASTIANVDAKAANIATLAESDMASADLFVIAGPVHFDRHDRALVRFVREHLGVMSARSSAFVSVSGKMASFNGRAEAQRYADDFLDRTGWIPDRVELVAGAIPYTHYGFLLRWVMRRIAAREGLDTDTSRDYVYTDWEALDAFIRQFVTEARSAAA